MAPTVQNDLAPEPVLDFESTSGRYTSRFLEDFEPVRLLGKGAYGLVFEAQKLIDRVHYAVKRIKLPSKKEDRVKVMREVTVTKPFIIIRRRKPIIVKLFPGFGRIESS